MSEDERGRPQAASPTTESPPCTIAALAERFEVLAERVTYLEECDRDRRRRRRLDPEDAAAVQEARWTGQVDRAVRGFRRGARVKFEAPKERAA